MNQSNNENISGHPATSPSDDRFEWLIAHMTEVMDRYAGRWVAVADGGVAGSGATTREAWEGAVARCGPDVRPLFSFVESTADVVWAGIDWRA